MTGETTLRSSEKRVLKALQDRKEYKNKDLQAKTHLSPTALSEALKRLQLPEKNRKVKRSVTSRTYSITSEGLKALKVEDTAKILTTSKTIRLETIESIPVDSIVAIDAPELSKAQQNVVMKGTVDVARAAFKQFFTDMQLREKDIPESGRIVYTASIDLRKAKEWLDSTEGKNYAVTFKGED